MFAAVFQDLYYERQSDGSKISLSPWGEGIRGEPFSGLCTVLPFGDRGYRFPPGPLGGVFLETSGFWLESD